MVVTTGSPVVSMNDGDISPVPFTDTPPQVPHHGPVTPPHISTPPSGVSADVKHGAVHGGARDAGVGMTGRGAVPEVKCISSDDEDDEETEALLGAPGSDGHAPIAVDGTGAGGGAVAWAMVSCAHVTYLHL